MTGITKSYIDSINDINSSGRDMFTVFSFMGVSHCSVRGIRFTGEWDGSGTFRYQSPRAKGVGVTGCTDCVAEHLYGSRLLATWSMQLRRTLLITGSIKYVAEFGFRTAMRNTVWKTDSIIWATPTIAPLPIQRPNIAAQPVLKEPTVNLTITGNLFANNKYTGLSISGKHVYFGNLPTGDIVLANNIIKDNRGFGIYVYPGVAKVTIDGNILSNNSQGNAYKMVINLVGSPTSRISDIKITINQLRDDVGNNYLFY
jgi:parallel beta-helix repeat protein